MKRQPITVESETFTESGYKHWAAISLGPIVNIGGVSIIDRKGWDTVPSLHDLYRFFMMTFKDPPDTSFVEDVNTYHPNVKELTSTFLEVTDDFRFRIIERPERILFKDGRAECRGGRRIYQMEERTDLQKPTSHPLCSPFPLSNYSLVLEYDSNTGFPTEVAGEHEIEKAHKKFPKYVSSFYFDNIRPGVKMIYRGYGGIFDCSNTRGPFSVYVVELTENLLRNNRNLGVRKRIAHY